MAYKKLKRAEELSTPSTKGFDVDLSTWTMGEYMAWTEAANAGDLKNMSICMSDVVSKWPFEGDPGELDSYKSLTPQQWMQAVAAMGAATGENFRKS